MGNIYVRFGGQPFREVAGISMGTNFTPLLADLFLYPSNTHVQSVQEQSRKTIELCFVMAVANGAILGLDAENSAILGLDAEKSNQTSTKF